MCHDRRFPSLSSGIFKISFKLSKKSVKPATEVNYSGFPMRSKRKKALKRNGLSGRRTIRRMGGNISRVQHIFALIIPGNSGGPMYRGNVAYGVIVIGNQRMTGYVVPSPLVIKTINGLQTTRECKMPKIIGNVPGEFMYDMMIPGCIRKSGSCVKAIIEVAPLNYNVICEAEKITNG